MIRQPPRATLFPCTTLFRYLELSRGLERWHRERLPRLVAGEFQRDETMKGHRCILLAGQHFVCGTMHDNYRHLIVTYNDALAVTENDTTVGNAATQSFSRRF